MAFQGKQKPDLMEYLADAVNFSIFFSGSPAAKSTPHLYISALSTWYQNLPVWAHWKHWFTDIPLISLKHTIAVPLLTMKASEEIDCIALSENGDLIVSGSQHQHLMQVWDAKTGEKLRELQGHTRGVISVAFSPDGNHIVSGSWDNSVQVWDAKTGEQLRVLQVHTDGVTSVAFSPVGNQIVSGSWDQSVWVWDTKTGEQLREVHGYNNSVRSVTFPSDGNKFISGSGDQFSHMNSSLIFSWVVNADGWIISDNRHLIWIPPTIRNVLCHPFNTLIISRYGSATISFVNSKFGHSWHECYTP